MLRAGGTMEGEVSSGPVRVPRLAGIMRRQAPASTALDLG